MMFIEVTDRNGTTIGVQLRYLIRYADRLIVIGGQAPSAVAIIEDLAQIRFKIEQAINDHREARRFSIWSLFRR